MFIQQLLIFNVVKSDESLITSAECTSAEDRRNIPLRTFIVFIWRHSLKLNALKKTSYGFFSCV